MKAFVPGAEYGAAFEAVISVCLNPEARDFARCNEGLSEIVYEGLKSEVARRGLARRLLVTSCGCVLGCKPEGATVMISSAERPARFYYSVRLEHVEILVEMALNPEEISLKGSESII